ncbi:MAG: hypothetical protein SFZ23_09625 [Planctomycetota bacterium]|nr:hypothetical protein [Planctomycetota bacterium]
MSTSERATRVFRAYGGVFALFFAASATLAGGVGGVSGRTQQCNANTACGLTSIDCNAGQAACCCRVSAGAYSCSRGDAACTPPAGGNCHEGANI